MAAGKATAVFLLGFIALSLQGCGDHIAKVKQIWEDTKAIVSQCHDKIELVTITPKNNALNTLSSVCGNATQFATKEDQTSCTEKTTQGIELVYKLVMGNLTVACSTDVGWKYHFGNVSEVNISDEVNQWQSQHKWSLQNDMEQGALKVIDLVKQHGSTFNSMSAESITTQVKSSLGLYEESFPEDIQRLVGLQPHSRIPQTILTFGSAIGIILVVATGVVRLRMGRSSRNFHNSDRQLGFHVIAKESGETTDEHERGI